VVKRPFLCVKKLMQLPLKWNALILHSSFLIAIEQEAPIGNRGRVGCLITVGCAPRFICYSSIVNKENNCPSRSFYYLLMVLLMSSVKSTLGQNSANYYLLIIKLFK